MHFRHRRAHYGWPDCGELDPGDKRRDDDGVGPARSIHCKVIPGLVPGIHASKDRALRF